MSRVGVETGGHLVRFELRCQNKACRNSFGYVWPVSVGFRQTLRCGHCKHESSFVEGTWPDETGALYGGVLAKLLPRLAPPSADSPQYPT